MTTSKDELSSNREAAVPFAAFFIHAEEVFVVSLLLSSSSSLSCSNSSTSLSSSSLSPFGFFSLRSSSSLFFFFFFLFFFFSILRFSCSSLSSSSSSIFKNNSSCNCLLFIMPFLSISMSSGFVTALPLLLLLPFELTHSSKAVRPYESFQAAFTFASFNKNSTALTFSLATA